jgi:SDR family mycofactocin-dependent oxidoreductase
MGMLEGKVAYITGAARGQGRSHAVRLAEEGADIIAMDICATPSTVSVPGATPEDLEETAALVEKTGRKVVARQGDVRDVEFLAATAREGVAELGRLDIVVANAGIWGVGLEEPSGFADRQRVWQESIDIDLTGVFNTLEATVPILVEAGNGGAIVLTSSTAGLKSMAINSLAQTAYTAAKHGVVGLMRNYAVELAPHMIRVNSIHPTSTATPMIMNDVTDAYLEEHPELAGLMANLLPVPAVDPVDISNGVLFLVSDLGRYVTGITLPVDAGFLVK